jgi:hypothetical protein
MTDNVGLWQLVSSIVETFKYGNGQSGTSVQFDAFENGDRLSPCPETERRAPANFSRAVLASPKGILFTFMPVHLFEALEGF